MLYAATIHSVADNYESIMTVMNVADLIVDSVTQVGITAENNIFLYGWSFSEHRLRQRLSHLVCSQIRPQYFHHNSILITFCRFDYLLVSHFLLNLEDISATTSEVSDPSQPSSFHASQGQNSSIRFSDSIIGNLGAPLRDGSSGDEDEIIGLAEDGHTPEALETIEEIHVKASLDRADIENLAGPSGVSVVVSNTQGIMPWPPSIVHQMRFLPQATRPIAPTYLCPS